MRFRGLIVLIFCHVLLSLSVHVYLRSSDDVSILTQQSRPFMVNQERKETYFRELSRLNATTVVNTENIAKYMQVCHPESQLKTKNCNDNWIIITVPKQIPTNTYLQQIEKICSYNGQISILLVLHPWEYNLDNNTGKFFLHQTSWIEQVQGHCETLVYQDDFIKFHTYKTFVKEEHKHWKNYLDRMAVLHAVNMGAVWINKGALESVLEVPVDVPTRWPFLFEEESIYVFDDFWQLFASSFGLMDYYWRLNLSLSRSEKPADSSVEWDCPKGFSFVFCYIHLTEEMILHHYWSFGDGIAALSWLSDLLLLGVIPNEMT